jgi:hypothetical protein
VAAGPPPPPARRGTLSAWLLAFGVLIVGGLVNRFRSDEWVQDLVARPIGLAVVAVVAVFMLGALGTWARPQARRPLVWAVLVNAAINTGVLMLANRLGWLRGTVVRPSLQLQALVYGLGFVALTLVPLALYRWLADRSRVLALGAYMAFVAAFSAASVPVERSYLASGVYVFENGYSMVADILWGVICLLFALALYQSLELSARK